MILIIGNDEIRADELKKSLKGEIICVDEPGRCIVPADAGEREYIELYGRNAAELAERAEEVYLIRPQGIIRLK